MAPGHHNARERGYTFVECMIVCAIIATFTGVAITFFTPRADDAHAAAIEFEGLVSTARAMAAANAAAPAGAQPVTGMTISVTAGTPRSIARLFVGRPEAGSTLPLMPVAAIGALTLPASLSITGAPPVQPPFSLFFGSSGDLSVAPGFDAATATTSLPAEPLCAGQLSIVFVSNGGRETRTFACENSQVLR